MNSIRMKEAIKAVFKELHEMSPEALRKAIEEEVTGEIADLLLYGNAFEAREIEAREFTPPMPEVCIVNSPNYQQIILNNFSPVVYSSPYTYTVVNGEYAPRSEQAIHVVLLNNMRTELFSTHINEELELAA